MKKSVILLLFVFLTQLLWAQLELPSRLTDRPERIIRHEAYTCSFNTSNLTPNYVAWCLTSERVKGYTKRTDFFDGDPKIESKYRVQHSDYSRSRYDRGHMCPAADNRQSYTAMTESFYMTNICPQNHALNVGAWNDLEIQCRTWAVNYGKVYIVDHSKNGTTVNGQKITPNNPYPIKKNSTVKIRSGMDARFSAGILCEVLRNFGCMLIIGHLPSPT